MASFDLYQGLCGICYGALTPQSALYVDCGDGRGGVHKGKCAYLYGEVAPIHQGIHDSFMALTKEAFGPVAKVVRAAYLRWLDSLGLEDYDHQFQGLT